MKMQRSKEETGDLRPSGADGQKRTRRRRKTGRHLALAYAIRVAVALVMVLGVVVAVRGVRGLFSRGSTAGQSGEDKVQNAAALAPQTDGEAVLTQKEVKPLGLTVVLDPGHGGAQPGCVIGEQQEKDIDMAISQRLKLQLEQMGFDVIMTRSSDADIGLSERAEIANEAQGDCFVSIHCNSYEDSSVSGLECYYFRSAEGKELAEAISRATSASSILTREIKEGNFQVLREADMPAVLIEVGYMTNPEELASLASDAYQQRLAESIADGIADLMQVASAA